MNKKPMAVRVKPKDPVPHPDWLAGEYPSTNDERLIRYLKKRAIYEANKMYDDNLKLIGEK